jgi:hypothetical protein
MYCPLTPIDLVEELPLVPTYANSAVVSFRIGTGGVPAGDCATDNVGAEKIAKTTDETKRRGMCMITG